MGIKVGERCEEGLLKPVTEIGPLEGEDVDILAQKSAVDRFYGMMKIPRKLADEIIDMEIWD
jgi:predicted DNA-binding antitoxin AbrB/MazE fold protein